jgi:hypothetical protein
MENNRFRLSEEVVVEIAQYIYEDTKIDWILPMSFLIKEEVELQKQTRVDLGYFECFLESAEFSLSYFLDTDLKQIMFWYKSKIEYRGGGRNGFNLRYLFDLDGNLIRKLY